jgi:hypothetical protein
VTFIRTYTADEMGPVPLPTLLVQHVLADPELDRLRFHQTGSNTTIVAREVDKGTGLLALLEHVGRPDLETVVSRPVSGRSPAGKTCSGSKTSSPRGTLFVTILSFWPRTTPFSSVPLWIRMGR